MSSRAWRSLAAWFALNALGLTALGLALRAPGWGWLAGVYGLAAAVAWGVSR